MNSGFSEIRVFWNIDFPEIGRKKIRGNQM